MESNSYTASLVRPIARKPLTRRVKSLDVEMLVEFGICTNVEGLTNLPLEALGCPYRLATNKDGSVRFTQSGNVSVRVAKEIVSFGTMMHQNIVAGIQADIQRVHLEKKEAVEAMTAVCVKAGEPIKEADERKLAEALKRRAEEEAKSTTPEPEKALVAA